jgi:hypothetical protein
MATIKMTMSERVRTGTPFDLYPFYFYRAHAERRVKRPFMFHSAAIAL